MFKIAEGIYTDSAEFVAEDAAENARWDALIAEIRQEADWD